MLDLRYTREADDFFSIFGSFGKVMGQVEGDASSFSVKSDTYLVTATETCDAYGVKHRKGKIQNVGTAPMELRSVLWNFVYDGGEYSVYTQGNTWSYESLGSWQTLNATVSAETLQTRDCFNATPFFVLWNDQTHRGTAFHIFAQSAWKYSVNRRRLGFGGDKTRVEAEMGIQNTNFSVTLQPGEALELPDIIYYEVRNKLDLDAWKFHRYFNETWPRREMPVIYNTWLHCYGEVKMESVVPQIERAAELGAEYFVIDAGWFGEGENLWKKRGDWDESQGQGFRGRMHEVADKVRRAGMKFGVWFEVECAGHTARIFEEHPEYFFTYKGDRFLDFTRKDACDYIVDKVCEIIEKNGVEYIKFDYNQDTDLDEQHAAHMNWRKGHRAVIERIHQRHPEVYLENCASGGFRMAPVHGTYFDSFWLSDNQSPYEGVRIFKDTVRRLPPQLIEKWACMQSVPAFREDYTDTGVGKEYEQKIIATDDGYWDNVRGVRPSWAKGFLTGGLIGFSNDLTRMDDAFFGEMQEHVRDFKAHRDFWKKAVCRILTDTKDLLVMQYSDMDSTRAEILVFTYNIRQAAVTVHPVMDGGKTYRCGEELVSGKALDAEGIRIPTAKCLDVHRIVLEEAE